MLIVEPGKRPGPPTVLTAVEETMLIVEPGKRPGPPTVLTAVEKTMLIVEPGKRPGPPTVLTAVEKTMLIVEPGKRPGPPTVLTAAEETMLIVEPGKRPGPPTVLTATEETMLCEWLLEMSRIGYGRTTEELKLVVKRILDKDGRPNPFCDNTPGYDWFTAFMKRLSIRQSESLPVSRAKGCSKEELDRWFSDFYDSFGRARTAEQARVNMEYR